MSRPRDSLRNSKDGEVILSAVPSVSWLTTFAYARRISAREVIHLVPWQRTNDAYFRDTILKVDTINGFHPFGDPVQVLLHAFRPPSGGLQGASRDVRCGDDIGQF